MKDKEKLDLFNESMKGKKFSEQAGMIATMLISKLDQVFYTLKNIKNRFFPSKDNEIKGLPVGKAEKRNIREDVHKEKYTKDTNAVSYEYAARVASKSNEEKAIEEVEKE